MNDKTSQTLISVLVELGFHPQSINDILLVFNENQGAKHAYHNSTHCVNVAISAKEIALAENPQLPIKLSQTLFLAGLFHDFNHTGDPSMTDDVNINLSCAAAKKLVPTIIPEIDTSIVTALILATEFTDAGKKRTLNEILSLAGSSKDIGSFPEFELLVNSIKDADFMEYFIDPADEEDFQDSQRIFEKRVAEFDAEVPTGLPFEQVLENSYNFLSGISFKTDTASDIADLALETVKVH